VIFCDEASKDQKIVAMDAKRATIGDLDKLLDELQFERNSMLEKPTPPKKRYYLRDG
jgi:hypothetical protein